MLYDDDDLNTKSVKLLGEKFISRKDVKARQAPDGAWMPVRKDSHDASSEYAPWTLMDFKMHLSGEATYGHYLLDTDNNCKLFAFDLDVRASRDGNEHTEPESFHYAGPSGEQMEFNPREVWVNRDTEHPTYERISRQLRGLAESLALAIDRIFEGEVGVAVCDTGGKGLHIYGFTGLQPASVARQAAHYVLETLGHGVFVPSRGSNFYRYINPEVPDAYDCVEIEVFPKQDELTDGGLGNLMALPCGVNKRTGRNRPFVTFRGTGAGSGEWTPIDQIVALEGGKPWD